MTTRRGFLGSILALGAAPAIVRADSLMRIIAPRPFLWGDGIHDDTLTLQAMLDEARGKDLAMPAGKFLISAPLAILGLKNFSWAGSHLISDRPMEIMFRIDGDGKHYFDTMTMDRSGGAPVERRVLTHCDYWSNK